MKPYLNESICIRLWNHWKLESSWMHGRPIAIGVSLSACLLACFAKLKTQNSGLNFIPFQSSKFWLFCFFCFTVLTWINIQTCGCFPSSWWVKMSWAEVKMKLHLKLKAQKPQKHKTYEAHKAKEFEKTGFYKEFCGGENLPSAWSIFPDSLTGKLFQENI